MHTNKAIGVIRVHSWPLVAQNRSRKLNWAALGRPVPVGIEGRTALKLANELGWSTPARARLPPAFIRPPFDASLKPPVGAPAESAFNTVSVPLKAEPGNPAAPTRFEMLNALNIWAVNSTLNLSRILKAFESAKSWDMKESPNR